jgi:uncharacterized protein YyaL (SSP411 family)
MANRLAGETSPYLRQHADNPVDWYPWGPQALERALADNKPILLSIGYSACHWCHVMAHESFEDPQVAAVMNRLFVSIKVDREERPDLDSIYQLAHQMLTGRAGGWPLTVFLTPRQVPFFAGTYFPKEARYQLPGFAQLCERIAQVWSGQQADIERQNGALLAAFSRLQRVGSLEASMLSRTPIDAALSEFKKNFDPRNGGFGPAPKFPHPSELDFCLRRFAATADKEALHIVTHTLERMALGGLYDQLGGGFSRYSVDASWVIPHFEKMLYDNGLLLGLYANAWTVTGNALFAQVVDETASWIMREMQSEGDEGAYYSSLDADSEHEEGKFYVWERAEVRGLLSPEEYALLASYYGLDAPANFEKTRWHLNVVRPLAEAGERLGWQTDKCEHLLASARAKLFAAREKRPHPGRDEKVLASWNALAIGGMARAASVFGRSEWIASAKRAFAFLRRAMCKDGKLLAVYKDGNAHLNAYLDDHAYLLAAALELVQADFDTGTLEFAAQLADSLLGRFEDRQSGGFYFTSHDHEPLLARLKPGADGATPSGNGIAAQVLQRMTCLTGETRYAEAAARALVFLAPEFEGAPSGHTALLNALEEHLTPSRTVILRGPSRQLAPWKARISRLYLPHTIVLAIADEFSELPQVLAKPVTGSVSAWLCEGLACQAPVSSCDELLALLCRSGQNE